MTLGDRIVIMKDGFIQQVGTPTEVFDMPVNLFVSEFIGAPKMNTFKTELVCEYGKYYVTPYGAKVEISGEKAKKLEEKLLPDDIDYKKITGLRLESAEKLDKIRPRSLGQAARISGVNPADISVLLIYLSSRKN
jgi:tRNA U34 5-carboxymethylaminomethyl modifying enzyme MnmG/GidA